MLEGLQKSKENKKDGVKEGEFSQAGSPLKEDRGGTVTIRLSGTRASLADKKKTISLSYTSGRKSRPVGDSTDVPIGRKFAKESERIGGQGPRWEGKRSRGESAVARITVGAGTKRK